MYIVEYAYGETMSDAINRLEEQVKRLIKDGYIPQGGVCITINEGYYTPVIAAQAMVLKN